MLIKVNGEEKEVAEEISISGYLEDKQINAQEVIIQYNGEIINKDRLAEVKLQSDDVLEILKFVGGG